MADDISRRIDDLLGGAIDEQVREQRVLNDMMIGVRDGVSRLVGDVAALSARVTESRETAQGLREELPFLVQREVTSAVNAMSTRIDVLDTAVGELVASIAGLEDRVGPDVIIGGVTQRLEAMREAQEEQAGAITAESARATIETAANTLRSLIQDEAASMRSSFDHSASATTELVDRHHTQISRRLADVKKWTDVVEGRMRALEKALEANVKMPVDVRKQLNELTGSTQDMTDSVLEEIRINAEAAASRITASVEGIDHEAAEMNRRFIEMNERLAQFQEQVLAYLQVRDVALEERRDQIVTELLSDFLNELPERDRERTVGRLRTVFARRRDRRDAERFRTGGTDTALPPVSPQAVAEAEADLQREQVLAERPWAGRAWAEPPAASRPEARPQPASQDEEVFDGEPVSPSRARATSAPAAKKSAGKSAGAKKAPAKPAKKAAAKEAPPKKPAVKKPAAKPRPVPVEPQVQPPEPQDQPQAGVFAEEPLAEEAFDVPVAEVTEAGEIDVVDLRAFAEPDGEDAAAAGDPRGEGDATPVQRPRSKPKTASRPKTKPAKKAPGVAPPEGEVGEIGEVGAPDPAGPMDSAGAGPEGSPETEEASEGGKAPAEEDTLQQALARVQALVDQHRRPGGTRKRAK